MLQSASVELAGELSISWNYNANAYAKLSRIPRRTLEEYGFKQPLPTDDPWHFEFI